ncbi:MAG: carboxypeptidase regulatory-like domain-containing protein [Planctomycetes bacterium]|nr:carboxypeptidase regulatory-like domain-containing protein [Planctomycetota bacterium]
MNRGKFVAAIVVGAFGLTLAAPAWSADNAVVKGKIFFKGNAAKYKRETINTNKDPNCKKSKKKIGSEKVILNGVKANKKDPSSPITIRNTMVYVKEGLGDRKFPVKAGSVELNQFGCQYKPHVIGIMEGQDLIVKNSDDTNHNIHFLPKVNKQLNFSQPKKGMTKSVSLKKEDVFKAKCDVHPWMGCYIKVFNHPFFAVTGKDGTFELSGLPPGKYVIEAWHEKFGTQTVTVEVAVDETKVADLTFAPK